MSEVTMNEVTCSITKSTLKKIHAYAMEALKPKVTFCNDFKKMKETADSIKDYNLSLIESELSNILRNYQ